MNGKPNVEPPWMSLKRLIETRMVEILRKEQGNRKYIRLYGAGEYWHAFEESACQLSRIFTECETALTDLHPAAYPGMRQARLQKTAGRGTFRLGIPRMA